MSEKLLIWMIGCAQKYGLATDLPDVTEQQEQAAQRAQAHHEVSHVVQQRNSGDAGSSDDD